MKSKILRLSIATALILNIIGCGSDSSSDSTNSDKNESTTPSDNRYKELLSYGVTPPLPSQSYQNETGIADNSKFLSDDTNITIKNLIIPFIPQDNNFTFVDNGTWNNLGLHFLPQLDKLSLLIIGDESFMDELERLKTHKNSVNMFSDAKSWQELAETFSSYGKDDPERIKQAIAYYKKNAGISYVMLVGDSDKFPMRFCKNYAIAGNYWVPTDLYYADIQKEDGSFDNWDGNGNGIFCEAKSSEANPKGGLINIDEIDGKMDVVVGRVPASNIEEVHNYVSKIIAYESKETIKDWRTENLMVVPGEIEQSGEFSWYRDSYPRSLALKEDVFQSLSLLSTVTRLYFDGAEAHTNLFESLPIILTKENIIESFNSGVGYVNFAGHGARYGWWLGTNESGSLGFFDINAIDNLSNTDKYPVVFSVACDTGKYYDNLKYVDTTNNQFIMNKKDKNPPEPNPIQPSSYDVDSMAEALLLHSDKAGAIAFISSTEAVQGKAQAIDKYFGHIYAQKLKIPHFLGDIWKIAMTFYKLEHVDMNQLESSNWTASIPFDHLLKYHLFGDPSLRLEFPYSDDEPK